MKKIKFNINNVESVNAHLYELKELTNTIDDLLRNIVEPLGNKRWADITEHERLMTVFQLNRDSGKLTTLLGIMRDKLLDDGKTLEHEITNYYLTRSKKGNGSCVIRVSVVCDFVNHSNNNDVCWWLGVTASCTSNYPGVYRWENA